MEYSVANLEYQIWLHLENYMIEECSLSYYFKQKFYVKIIVSKLIPIRKQHNLKAL